MLHYLHPSNIPHIDLVSPELGWFRLRSTTGITSPETVP